MPAKFIPTNHLYFLKLLQLRGDNFIGKTTLAKSLAINTCLSVDSLVKILLNLLENGIVSINGGQLNHSYLDEYGTERNKFKELQKQSALSAVVSGGQSYDYDYKKEPAWQHISDKYCNLSKEDFGKLSKDKKIDIRVDQKFLERSLLGDIRVIDHLVFKLSIEKEKLKKYLDDFLDSFIKNEFNDGLRYSYEKHITEISIAIQKLFNAGYSKESIMLDPTNIFPKERMDMRPTDNKLFPAILLYDFVSAVLAMEKQGLIEILEIKRSKYNSIQDTNTIPSYDTTWDILTEIKFRVRLIDKFPLIISPIKNENIRYEYDKITGIGKLFIGDFTAIPFKKLRAKILDFFYSSFKATNEYQTYHHFNNYPASDEQVGSDEFSKEIKAINKRIRKEIGEIMREDLIAKKITSKKNEANLYMWQDKI